MKSSYPSSKTLTCGCALAVLMLLAAPSLFAQAVSARLEGVAPNFTGQPLDFSHPFDNGTQITTLTAAQKAQFSNPGPGEAGGLPKLSLRSPGFSTLDMSLFKSFRPIASREQLRIQVRGEFFNILNKVNFGNPDTNINSPSFGVVTGSFPARIGQVALKVIF